MNTYKLAGEDLLALLHGKGNICISIIVPVHRLAPERRADPIEVKEAIEAAEQQLNSNYPKEEVEPLTRAMQKLYDEIDFEHNMEGLGLFVSKHISLSIPFPFPVEEKVIVTDNFEIRDVVYKMNYGNPYLLVMLSQEGSRLFEGKWDDLVEVNDFKMPAEPKDDYAYSKPVRSSSYAGHAHVKIFEKDKSELENIRVRDFFREVDKILDSYIVKDMPLLITGVEKNLSLFSEVSQHDSSVAGKIEGNYEHLNTKQLSEKAWPLIRGYYEKKWMKMIDEFREKFGEGLGVSGIQETWRASREGKALKLLVEKDYKQPGFLTENDYHLYLRQPKVNHKALADAVDDIIETVLEKNGKVYFVENGLLEDYERIALITRY